MLYLMRHGKTDWNAEYKLQGGKDIPLNPEGIQMAKEAAEKYRDVPFDICFVSPLSRALDTARILLQGRDIPVIVDERLVEMRYGRYEGTDHIYRHPELPIYKLFQDPENYVPEEGAESFDELFCRTGEFLEEQVEPLLKQGKNVLIVGHGSMNTAIINRYKEIPLKNFWDSGQKNCVLMEVETDRYLATHS